MVYETGCKTVNLLCKGSLNHLRGQLGKTKEEHLADIKAVVRYAQSKGILYIYQGDGKLVAQLQGVAGIYTWRGETNTGMIAKAGIYFYSIPDSPVTIAGKIVKIK